MIGMPNINQYFKVAMSYPVEKLQAVMRGQDKSIPMIAAMAAFEVKGPMEIAAKAQQALAKKSTVNVREKLAQEGQEEQNGMLPDNLMMAMQQQQQGSLPENTGIGQLPAPNMQTMSAANGGIIAFDDGGYVPGYAGDDLFAGSDVNAEEVAALRDDQVGGGAFTMNTERNPFRTPAMAKAEEARKLAEAEDVRRMQEGRGKAEARSAIAARIKQIEDQWRKDSAAARAANQPRPPLPAEHKQLKEQLKTGQVTQPTTSDLKSSQDSAFGSNLIISDKPGETVNTGIPQVLPKADAAKRAAVSRASPADVPIAAPKAGPTAAPQGVDTEQKMADAMSRITGTKDAEILGQYKDLEKKTDTGIAALRREREVGKPTGKAYEGLETELKEEKDAAKNKEAKNLQMALINAGLAIAGGSSRYAMENIGKGALVGTKQYMDGLDKLEAAAKERRKMTAMIDEARRAEARGDWKEKNEFETKAFDIGMASRRYSIDGLAKIYDKNTKAATEIFNRLEADKAANERNEATNRTSLQTTGMTTAASRENAAAMREQNQMYREGTLRQQAQENARKLLDDKMNTFKLEKLTVTPQVYEQWRQFYLDQAFKDAGINRGGGGDMFKGTKEDDALINKYRGR